MKRITKYLFDGSILLRSVLVSALLAVILTLINHYSSIMNMDLSESEWIQIAFTYLVLFLASLCNFVAQALQNEKHAEKQKGKILDL
ncbi:hypothetical protein CH373_18100 [Leptospira perolatii]|uniref:Uncharacterized protein n=1 Tax=Leptospira perolatii TaxID=2023191 RepID=A0A2M9ZIC0_9LEPT|nr:hypothetical protein [Leptospira perolatii]PJZ68066.1 hypothetical protein CH360_18145 [Leptospira perolatii]PJZ71703.1 hypothetical protein CH373_18100 [Leptospira perolatii]